MANEQNLRPSEYKLSREEAKKGGQNSVKSRRERKKLREELLMLLESGDTQNRIAVALIKEAIDGNSSQSVVRAFEAIRDTIGEKPVDKVMIAEVDQSVIDEVERAVLGDSE